MLPISAMVTASSWSSSFWMIFLRLRLLYWVSESTDGDLAEKGETGGPVTGAEAEAGTEEASHPIL
jgi:hypothetical protein